MPDGYMTVQQVAAHRHVSASRIRAVIAKGDLAATKFGRAWAIKETDLDAYQPQPRGNRSGRPRTKRYTVSDLALLIEKLKRTTSETARTRLLQRIATARRQIVKEQMK